MFHFGARAAFLREAARILRGGGRLVVSDILLRQPGADAGLNAAAIETILGGEYGPWPQPWATADDIHAAAAQSGLTLDRVVDATRQTLPTYRVTAPLQPGRERIEPRPSAGHVLRWMHSEGYLSYLCMVFGKR
jgi:SAM-dependent methyltransferase